MVKVKSSQLDSAGYDEETNDLYVEFSSGIVYKYSVVPKRVFDRFIGHGNGAGAYFHLNIRMNYRYKKTELKVENSTIQV